jgi:hypothetical protein
MYKDTLFFITSFFYKEKYKLIETYYQSSLLGSKASALSKLRSLLAYFVYQDKYIQQQIFNEYTDEELIKCLESCNLDLLKLRKALENLKGVNIDIIENEDVNKSTLVVY